MRSLERYIFRTTFSAFLIVLVSLIAIFWVTQALRKFDLVTNQGQTILTLLDLTALFVPLIIQVLAPVALLIAVVHVLTKLSIDSEIIVMNAAGMSPWYVFRAFMTFTIVVSIIVAAMSAYFAPKGLRLLRERQTKINTALVNTIIQPGHFATIANGTITIRIGERLPTGQLAHILLDDARNPGERITVLAEAGNLIDDEKGTFLVLFNGTVQRHPKNRRDPVIVKFDRYAIDLSEFAMGSSTVQYSIHERYLWQLILPNPKDPLYIEQPKRFRAEMHDRLVALLYPITFVVIAFAYLGVPRTTRKSRSTAILGAVGGVALLRLIGFASIVFGETMPWMLLLQYIAIVYALVAGIWVIRRGLVLELPEFVTNTIEALAEHMYRLRYPSVKL